MLLWPKLNPESPHDYNIINSTTTIANSTSSTKTTPNSQFCLSRECIHIASTILDRLDAEADACDDMYAFACGNFIASQDVPEDYYARNLLQEIQEGVFVEMKHYFEEPEPETEENATTATTSEHHIVQIKRLYNSCMEAEATSSSSSSSIDGILMDSYELGGSSIASLASRGPLEALYRLIIQLTGVEWPVLGGDFGNGNASSTPVPPPTFAEAGGPDGFSLEQQLALLYLYQVQPFFQLFVAPHRNTSTYALHVRSNMSSFWHFFYSLYFPLDLPRKHGDGAAAL